MMTFLTLALLGVVQAHAGPTINLSSVASEADGVTVYAGSGAALFDFGPLPTGRIGAEFHHDRLQVTASTTTYVSRSSETFNLLGASWAVVSGQRLRLGPVINFAEHRGSSPLDHRISGRIGLSVDTGTDHLRFDATVSLYGFGWHPSGAVETPLYILSGLDTGLVSELGVRKSWGNHRARLGVFGPMPTIGYTWDTGKWLLRTDVASIGSRSLIWLQAGWRL